MLVDKFRRAELPLDKGIKLGLALRELDKVTHETVQCHATGCILINDKGLVTLMIEPRILDDPEAMKALVQGMRAACTAYEKEFVTRKTH